MTVCVCVRVCVCVCVTYMYTHAPDHGGPDLGEVRVQLQGRDVQVDSRISGGGEW